MQGRLRKCSYCGKRNESYLLDEIAGRVETAFAQYFTRTSEELSSLRTERDGDQVVHAIMNAADMPEESAQDIQKILGDKYADFESAKMGDETEFSSGSHYAEKGVTFEEWHRQWHSFENSLKTEARFFSQFAARHLASVFAGIETMSSNYGRPLIVDAGPNTSLASVYRARRFEAEDKLTTALIRPDLSLGPPAARQAKAGRMNAGGISVFYGANDPFAAISEIRPPVGSWVAVACFTISRPLRLLDLTALSEVTHGSGSIFDPVFIGQLERTLFLQSLSQRITRPIMPDDELLEYLPTQAVADFLATASGIKLDGILFPSAQVAGDALNIVLFHKAARVEEMDIPEGTKIEASSGNSGEDGWETNYMVYEEVPRKIEPPARSPQDEQSTPFLMPAFSQIIRRFDADEREPTLRIDANTVKVHRVLRVQVETEEHEVTRHRIEKSESAF